MKTEAEIRAEIERLTSAYESLGGDNQTYTAIYARRAALKWVLADSKPQETPNAE